MDNNDAAATATLQDKSQNELIEQNTSTGKRVKNEHAFNNFKVLLLVGGIYSLIYNQAQKKNSLSASQDTNYDSPVIRAMFKQDTPNTFSNAFLIMVK